MKRLLFLVLASFLLVAACGQKEKEETKTEEKKKDTTKEKDKKKETKKEDAKKEDISQSNNQQTQSNETQQSSTPQINLSNITDRSTLESVINGNYSEEQKIQAYNSAVANGVIPQGNVTEGSASAAYQSSLRVESGAEKSVYEENGAQYQQDNTPYEKEYTNDGHEKYNNNFSNDQINEEQSNLDSMLEKGTISQEQYDQWSQQIRN